MYYYEVKLMLFRHWTLKQSMLNSNYFVSKMHLWKEPGRKDLDRLISEMGVDFSTAN